MSNTVIRLRPELAVSEAERRLPTSISSADESGRQMAHMLNLMYAPESKKLAASIYTDRRLLKELRAHAGLFLDRLDTLLELHDQRHVAGRG